jgi:hypothetical protein
MAERVNIARFVVNQLNSLRNRHALLFIVPTAKNNKKLFTAETQRRRENIFLFCVVPSAQYKRTNLCVSAVNSFSKDNNKDIIIAYIFKENST